MCTYRFIRPNKPGKEIAIKCCNVNIKWSSTFFQMNATEMEDIEVIADKSSNENWQYNNFNKMSVKNPYVLMNFGLEPMHLAEVHFFKCAVYNGITGCRVACSGHSLLSYDTMLRYHLYQNRIYLYVTQPAMLLC
ncbi:hypothetical protein Droror1_Dr00027616 [Drosera rotundifolia]